MKKNTKALSVIDIRGYDYLGYNENNATAEFRNSCDKKNMHYFQFQFPGKFNTERIDTSFWKYLDLESALLCLRYGNIRFVEPTRWEDKYEGRFYNADYSQICQDSNEYPFLYACCMTHKPHNEAAWKVYSYGKTGLGAHCVQFKINRSRFRHELVKNAQDLKFIVEGNVLYYKEKIINYLHKKEIGDKRGKKLNTNYSNFFDNFNFRNYINLLLLKRDYFEHENETRFFLIPRQAPQEKSKKSGDQYGIHKDVSIDWGNVIEEVRIDSKCTSLEYELLKEACYKLLPTFDEKNATAQDFRNRKKQIEKLTPIKTDIYGKRQNIKILG